MLRQRCASESMLPCLFNMSRTSAPPLKLLFKEIKKKKKPVDGKFPQSRQPLNISDENGHEAEIPIILCDGSETYVNICAFIHRQKACLGVPMTTVLVIKQRDVSEQVEMLQSPD